MFPDFINPDKSDKISYGLTKIPNMVFLIIAIIALILIYLGI